MSSGKCRTKHQSSKLLRSRQNQIRIWQLEENIVPLSGSFLTPNVMSEKGSICLICFQYQLQCILSSPFCTSQCESSAQAGWYFTGCLCVWLGVCLCEGDFCRIKVLCYSFWVDFFRISFVTVAFVFLFTIKSGKKNVFSFLLYCSLQLISKLWLQLNNKPSLKFLAHEYLYLFSTENKELWFCLFKQ